MCGTRSGFNCYVNLKTFKIHSKIKSHIKYLAKLFAFRHDFSNTKTGHIKASF